jgi:hypothetical protein
LWAEVSVQRADTADGGGQDVAQVAFRRSAELVGKGLRKLAYEPRSVVVGACVAAIHEP